MADERYFLACIARLLRFSGFAEGVFWRSFMDRGVGDGLPSWYNLRCKRGKKLADRTEV